MTHRYRAALVLCCGLLILCTRGALAVDFTAARVAVYFSPTGGATDAVVHEVNAAPNRSWCRRTASPRHRLPQPW